MLLPPVVVLPDRLIVTAVRQTALRPCNPALDPTGDDGDDGDAERRQLDAEGVAVSVEGRLGGVVDGAEDVGYHSRHRPDLDDRPFRSHEQGGEGLTDAHHGKHVDFERLLHFVEVDVESGNGVIWDKVQSPSVLQAGYLGLIPCGTRTPARVVDQEIQTPTSPCLEGLPTSFDAVRFVDFKAERLDAKVVQIGDSVPATSGGKDAEPCYEYIIRIGPETQRERWGKCFRDGKARAVPLE